jgi:hypothetical protein
MIRSFRFPLKNFLLLLVIGASPLAFLKAAQPLSVTGIMTIGPTRYASFSVAQAAWLHENEVVGALVIKRIDATQVVLIQASDNTEVTLALGEEHTMSQERPASTPAWIDSKDNPMLSAPTALPDNVVRNWLRMSATEQAAIVDEYARHGWRLDFTKASWGGLSFVWDNPLSTEHENAIQADRSAFADNLTEKQAFLWKRLLTPYPVKPGVVDITPAQRVAIEQRAEDIENLYASVDASKRPLLVKLTSYLTPAK